MPKLVDHEKYREELLLNSFDLFASRGYANVTMREIAAALNISTGGLYHYFSNKQTMLEKMIALIASREINQVLDIVYQSDDIEARVGIFLNYFKEREDYFKHVLLLLLDFKKYCASLENQKALDRYAEIIFKHIAEGVGTGWDFGGLAMSFLAGIGYMLLIVPDVINVDDQIALIRKMVNPFLQTYSTYMQS